MHCGGGGLGGRRALAAGLIAACLAGGSGAKAWGHPLWRFDRNRPGISTQCLTFGSNSPEKARAGIFWALSDPYLLDGLVAGELLAGFEASSYSLWIDWRHLGHPLYRQDNIAAALGLEIPAWGIRVDAVPSVDRRAVEGCAAEQSHSLSLSVSYTRGRSTNVGFVRSVYESDGGSPKYAAAFISVRAGSCVAAFERVVSGWRAGDSRLLLEARLDERLSIPFSYRWTTGELSSGLVLRLSCVLVGFLWSENPALGSTLSAGIGRWWER